MPHRPRRCRGQSEEGFTFIELLVVTLVLGLLAAIALPTFLSQERKGQGASAKSDARNLVSQVESCFADQEDYTLCDTVAELGTSGLNLVDGTPTVDGTVGVAAATRTTYSIVARSLNQGNTFTISKTPAGTFVRTCTGGVDGGCNGGSW